jgi:dTDP-glucose pyrophosphorylase
MPNEKADTGVVAVIPAAGLGQRLMPISSAIPKAMVPIAGQPLISLIVNHLARQGVRRFVFVVGRHGDQLTSYLERTYGNSSLELCFVQQTELDGPLGAVRLAEPLAGDNPQLVYLGDTLTRDELVFDRDFVLAHPVEDHYRWCLVKADDQGCMEQLIDKPLGPHDADLALIGVYYFSDGALWRRCTEEVHSAGETVHGEFQLSSAIARYNACKPIEVRRASEWFDCGSIDRYVDTRRHLLQSRRLNTIWVDDLGILHKRSYGSDDLAHEIQWYLSVPESVKPLVPRVFGYSLSKGGTHIDLEYVPVPTLAEVYLYANVHPEVWEYAFSRILDLWKRVFYDTRSSDERGSAKALSMYWEKTESRLAEAADSVPFQDRRVRLNGRELPSWQEMAPRVRAALETVARRPHWSLIHGDFHFGNILFDFNSGQLKLVDPRGAFGDVGCYGDARYDLAKFLHSFDGGYAHLAAGMFELSQDESDGFDLRLYGGSDRDHLLACFWRWLASTGIDPGEIMLIEGLLFLSLLPLHADDPSRQAAAYLTGLTLVTDALERIGDVARVR